VAIAGNKSRCFVELDRLGFAVPRTIAVTDTGVLERVPFPCIIKPSAESGGSSFVFFARDRNQAELYASYLMANGKLPIAQEYISHQNGEFTVGVLSDLDGSIAGVIAMKRAFPAKLSIMAQGDDFLISSGISQGRFDDFPTVCAYSREIAKGLGSVGPLNIQGRIDENGKFLPFEINPRFSASTYLRALAGFNEVDFMVKRLMNSEPAPLSMSPGWYLRGVTEVVVRDQDAIS
jgi:carbamoyl-phosphate synthase large subunit